MSQRDVVRHLDFKLAATVVNTSVWQEYLHGMRIIPPESILYTHFITTDFSYHIELWFVSAHSDLMVDPKTLTADSQSDLP